MIDHSLVDPVDKLNHADDAEAAEEAEAKREEISQKKRGIIIANWAK